MANPYESPLDLEPLRSAVNLVFIASTFLVDPAQLGYRFPPFDPLPAALAEMTREALKEMGDPHLGVKLGGVQKRTANGREAAKCSHCQKPTKEFRIHNSGNCRRTKTMAASVSDSPLATVAANGNTDLDSLTSNLNQLSISNSDVSDWSALCLECYHFPPLFEPRDVVDLLADDSLKSLCEGKWGSPEGDTSKTSILLVFAERSVAKRAFATLSCRRELKVRPWPAGVQSSDSQLGSPSPSKRPLRTDAVARRLIAGALGLKLEKKSAEAIARDEEKKRLVREERVAQSRAAARREEEFQKAWDE
ncbi:hypothetical protein HDU77_006957 [Chytriomyces hyalinus]|nr:hypothetical protein HDU77_006957 [Chytriomyces hyalinus]